MECQGLFEPMTKEIDLPSLKDWVGRSEKVGDYLTNSLVDRFCATLDPFLWLEGRGAPLGIHWCTTVSATHKSKLSEDGHAEKGDFCRLCGFLPGCGPEVKSSTTKDFLQTRR